MSENGVATNLTQKALPQKKNFVQVVTCGDVSEMWLFENAYGLRRFVAFNAPHILTGTFIPQLSQTHPTF